MNGMSKKRARDGEDDDEAVFKKVKAEGDGSDC